MKAMTALGLAAVLTLGACATSTEDEPRLRGVAQFEGDPRLGEEVRQVCFASSIDSFSSPTRDTVVVEKSPTKSYLVEVFGACFNLDQAQTIALAAKTGCLSKGDSLIVSDSAFGLRDSSGLGPSRCTVKAIYDWDEKAAKKAEEMQAEEAEMEMEEMTDQQ